MNPQAFENAVALAERRQHLLISTTDKSGIPHIASVGSFDRLEPNKVTLDDWHCPATLLNLQDNSNIALVVWDIATDAGYQLLGEVEAVRPSAYASNTRDRELVVRVHKVLSFSHASHTDMELEEDVDLSQATPSGVTAGAELSPDPEWHSAYLYLGRPTLEL